MALRKITKEEFEASQQRQSNTLTPAFSDQQQDSVGMEQRPSFATSPEEQQPPSNNKLKDTPDNSPKGWLDRHPWMKIGLQALGAEGVGAKTATKVLKFGKETLVDPLAREFVRPAATIAGKTLQTPFGEVKPMDITGETQLKTTKESLTSKEAGWDAVGTALNVIPVGKLGSGAVGVAEKVIGKKLPSLVPKVGSILANVPKEKLEFAATKEGAKLVRGAMKEGESALPRIGEDIFGAAKRTYKAAQEAWAATEEKILSSIQGDIPKVAESLSTNATEILQKEGVQVAKDGSLSLAGSKFSRNSVAQKTFDDLFGVINEPVTDAASLLNKRQAITGIMEQIPKEATNVRRVARSLVESFDTSLDNITSGQSKELNVAYKKAVAPAKKIMQKITDENGQLSMDKAVSFVKQAMNDARFDNATLLSQLDEVAGTNFAQEAKSIGVARAIEKLDPATGGRVKDVLISFTIAKVPLLSALVSPRIWGEKALRIGEKTILKNTNQIRNLIIQNAILKTPSKLLSPSIPQYPDEGNQ